MCSPRKEGGTHLIPAPASAPSSKTDTLAAKIQGSSKQGLQGVAAS